MTKKIEKIIKKYEESLNTQYLLYNNGFIDIGGYLKGVHDEEHRVQDMVSHMMHFKIISIKEFESCYLTFVEIAHEYADKL